MEFEDILKDVGDFGVYQGILVIAFIIPTYTLLPWFTMNAIFISNTPDHWCHVPEIDSLNLPIETQKYLIRPTGDRFCTRYDVNYTQILQAKNFTVDTNWPVKKCDSGWNYDKTDYDETAVTNWNLVCDRDHYKSLIVSCLFLGVVFGTPLYGFLSDRIGRKPTFFSLILLVALSEIGSVFCPSFPVFLLLRALIGSSLSSLFSLGYIITLELVRPDLRARINGIATNSWTIGLCLLSLVAYLTRNWVYLTFAVVAGACCILLYFRVLPESPSWLISQERYEEAAEIMFKIGKRNGTKIQYDHLLQNIQNLGKKKKEETREKNSPMHFFTYPTMRKRFFLIMAVWIGVNVPYYGLQVNVTNLSGNEFFNYFLISIVEIPAHLITWWLLNNVGRRNSSLIGFTICGISCLVPAFFPQDFEKLGVIVTLIAKAGSGAAFMSHYQHCPELFPTSLRGFGMGLTNTIGGGSALFTPYIARLEMYGSHIPFLVFSIICIVAGICVSLLPETLNKNLPQTVDDVEKFAKYENGFSCGWNDETYDLERKKSSSLSDNMPPFVISKSGSHYLS